MKIIKDELPDNFVCYFFDSNIRRDIIRVTLREEVPDNNEKYSVYFHLPVFIVDAIPRSVNILLDIFKCTFDLYDIKLSSANWVTLEAKLYEVLECFNRGQNKDVQ